MVFFLSGCFGVRNDDTLRVQIRFWSHPDTDSDPSECRTLDTDAWHFLSSSRASCIRSQTYRRVAREMQQANRVSKALNKR